MGGLQPGVNVYKIWAGDSRLGETVSSFLRLGCKGEGLSNQKFEGNFPHLPHTHLHQVPTQGPGFTSTFVKKVETERRIMSTQEALTSNSG